eukprot:scaffold69_cov248-Pinguiococcus_pyrenoidosus.AAC.38
MDVLDDVRALAKDAPEALDGDAIKGLLRERLVDTLDKAGDRSLALTEDPPTVFFVMGANGMGKTTTIGKLAHRLANEGGQRVLLAAADTFRAAAVDQLEMWAQRADVDIVVPEEGQKKPFPVVAKAIDKARDEGYDTVIVDTSGRLANNYNLNEELRGIKDTIKEKIPTAPHETLLVVDAALGRNAVDQVRAGLSEASSSRREGRARIWQDEVGLTGMVVTKLDGTARGGFVISTVRELKLPVKLVGVGEGIDDLRDFDAPAFVDALLGYQEGDAEALQQRLDATRQKAEARRAEKKRQTEEALALAMSAKQQEMEATDEDTPAPKSSGGKSKSKKKKKKNKKR